LASVEFTVNNKVYLATQVFSFMRELRMRTDIERKGKVEKTINFVTKMK